MAKLTVHDSNEKEPPKQVKAEKKTITDSRGRVMTLRKISPLWQSRIYRGLGAESSNESYMSMFVLPMAMIASIDDEEYQVPTNVSQVEAMLTILGDEGIAAIVEHFNAVAEEGKKQANDGEVAAIKN
jgi:hypothetical protein